MQSRLEERNHRQFIAAHGPNGNPKETWKNSKNKAFWLQDYLPLDVTGARVMMFGYNVTAAYGNAIATIIDHPNDFLSSLIDKREGFDARIEPQYTSLVDNTIGILILGTPHLGSEKANEAKVLANVATSVTNKPTPQLLLAPESNSDHFLRLTSDFKFHLLRYRVASFYELNPIGTFPDLNITFRSSRHSALAEFPGEDQIPVDANHRDMCIFLARDGAIYEKLLKESIENAEREGGGTGDP
ncbi:MAG: hypothetical protein M1827_001330 [Pycnora praestabilis]|nr:MAG: hypothetical protein M1827_001330 [Pycnora praestabilis]